MFSMRKAFLALFTFLICYIYTPAQSFIVRGYILDSLSGEVLISANCLEKNSGKGAISNTSGYYLITLPEGRISLNCSYVGYKPAKEEFNLKSDTVINFLLNPGQLNEILVVRRRESNLNRSTTGLNVLSVKTLNSIPSFTGEPDIIKAITFLPGVSSGREGISDFYVRGGDRGQNLILLDGAKVYNSNHVGGFISLFNSDIIKSVDLYKGGFPSRFGGRISSVLDIHTRDGNKNEKHSNFKLGVLQSGLLFEGPFKNNKTTCLFALRGSYLDILTLPLRISIMNSGSGSIFGYTFIDLNAKIKHQINNRNKIFANFYLGYDIESSSDISKYETMKDQMQIHTTLFTLGHTFNPSARTFLKTSIAFSDYGNKLSSLYSRDSYLDKSSTKLSSMSSIYEINLKSVLDWNLNRKHVIKAGIEFNKYLFTPGRIKSVISDSLLLTKVDTLTGNARQHSMEGSIFFEDDIRINEVFNINAGLRAVGYFYKQSEYFSIEPRLSLRIMLSENISAKINYTRMVQYNHALVSNYQGFEREVWIAATDNIPSQKADQYSIGVYGEIDKFKIEYSLECYYKKMNDLIFYSSSTGVYDDFSDLNRLTVTGGEGWSYGVEFYAQRNTNHFTSALSYTLSWNFRRFSELNYGQVFPFRYDRRHNLSLIAGIRLNKYYTLNSNFILSTGTPFTLPVSYSKDNRFTYGYFNYAGINNMSLPLYHRLDIGIEKTGLTKKGNAKRLSLNVFNVYARKNPVYIYYNPYNGKTFKKSQFSIVPSLSYSIEF